MQVVDYANIQFIKHKAALAGMGCMDLHKSPAVIEELLRKGIALKEG